MQSAKQSADCVIMIRPKHFGANPETAASNAFQAEMEAEQAEHMKSLAVLEFDSMVDELESNDIEVIVVEDRDQPNCPDAVFPNNWFSLHEDGRVALYPMESSARRKEVRMDIFQELKSWYVLTEAVDYTGEAELGRFLEGTGSMVLDRVNRVAYACHSSRTNLEVLTAFLQDFEYTSFMFVAADGNGVPIYHTNVMMAIGSTWCVVCLEAVQDPIIRNLLKARLSETGRQILTITLDELSCFAGNMLEVRNRLGQPMIVLSQQAYESLSKSLLNDLAQHGELIPVDITTIETYGGGSVRCMMAENFLPAKE